MKKKWMLTAVLVLAAVLLAGCTISPDGLSRLNRLAQGQSLTDSDSDTVTISRDLYERYRQFDELLELMDVVDYYYYQEPNVTDMLQGASAGLLAGLQDPYTFYYTPEAWKKMKEDDEGEYAGVGILISSNYRTGVCTISRVFKGSPAEAAGVQRGDILYRIGEDLYVVPETLQDAVDIMRGTPGTSVDVTFLRDGEEITFNLTRANITVNQVESTMLTEEIGLIAVYEFAGKVDAEFEEALNDLISRGAKGLIIDLRDNPGGWVDSAQQVGDLFMDAGDLCYLVYRDGTEDHCYPTRDGKIEIPLVTLVNENSASASEILTGALRERAGATVVGVNTYGKGIVQAVLPIGSEGAGYQITIAEYRTPEGGAVHKVGLAPDVEIPLEEGDNGGYDFADSQRDPQLKKALEVMEEKLK
jgi:carboxyl-terminal processing protease